jgi:hypothetical protein
VSECACECVCVCQCLLTSFVLFALLLCLVIEHM